MAKQCCVCSKRIGFRDAYWEMSKIYTDYVLCGDCYETYNRLKDTSEDTYQELVKAFQPLLTDPSTPQAIKDQFPKSPEAIRRAKLQETTEEERLQVAAEVEKKRQKFAKSFNEFYEYDVVTIINENHGTVDKEHMMQVLADHASKGWRLHSIYSNELGKKALSVLGLGLNSTACEDVLIFERRIEIA